jgi:hypothetical protein
MKINVLLNTRISHITIEILKKNCITFVPFKKGPVAEWLGRALQKLPQRFESARDLKGENHNGVILTSP